ncbi:MAG TPA: glycosyltransferase family 2 protein [Verrucomicrobiota bacterium]|nr:glycosyltransferase family 2 protein [Verrucomicrobiota bacterium]
MANDQSAKNDEPVELSIIMPCLNEAKTIGVCIKKAQGFLQSHSIKGEIVIGDNGSTDGSKQIARELGARVVDVPIRGYGAALMGAIKAAKGKYIIMADSDDSYDLTNLMPFVEKLRQGYDLVMGNRFSGGIKEGAMPFLNRYIGNPILSSLGKLFFKTNISDFHCGIRGFSKESVIKMDLQTTGMEFASEMVVKASLLKMRTCEVPTTLSPDGRGRPPHLRRWRDGWRHLRFMLLYSPRWLFFYPGILLMLSGIIISLWLLPAPRQVGKMVFDIHTLLYGAFAILVGYQILLFAIYTKIFAIAEGLLPQDERLNKIFKYVKLETGIVVGAVLSIIGIAGSIYAVWSWQRTGFGPLNPSEMFRMIIPSMIALMLGIQTIFSSFFLSVLGMKRK